MYTRRGIVTMGGVLSSGLVSHWLLGSASAASPTSSVKVAATIFPLYDLVRQVAGPDTEVVLVVPPGASPHTFTPKPSRLRALTGSATLFAIGHGLDDWAVQLAHDLGVPQTLRVDAQIALRQESHVHQHAPGTPQDHQTAPTPQGTVDPHYWLAMPNAIHMVQTIAMALGRLNPAAAAGYQQRALAYQAQLQTADREMRQQLAACSHHDIAIFHPAFDYFAAAYGLRIVAAFEPAPGREPTPRQVQHFLEQIRAHQLSALYIEPQLPQGPLRSLAHDLDVTLVELDPLGGSPGRDSYMALMRFNTTQLMTVLCK